MVGTCLWMPAPWYRIIRPYDFECTYPVKPLVYFAARGARQMRPQMEAANIEPERRNSTYKQGFTNFSSEVVIGIKRPSMNDIVQIGIDYVE